MRLIYLSFSYFSYRKVLIQTVHLFDRHVHVLKLPMIYFHTDENITKEIFMNIYEKLQKGEELEYPYHYETLEKKQELYKSYIDKRNRYKD